MKAPPDRNSRTVKVYLKPPAAQQKASAPEPKKPEEDRITLSPHMDEVRRFREMARSLPDVQQDKVDAIKKQIKDGTYQVPAESVVERIVDLHKKLNSDTG